MTTYFVDTSALGKRYVSEVGSAWVRTELDPNAGNHVSISLLAVVEVRSTFARRVRDGTLRAATARRLQIQFQGHLASEYVTIALDQTVLQTASVLVGSYVLRTLDAIHLASAMSVARLVNDPVTLLSSDRRLLAAAAAEGFATDDPNNHP